MIALIICIAIFIIGGIVFYIGTHVLENGPMCIIGLILMCGIVGIAIANFADHIGDRPQEIVCNECEAEIKENHKFCFECGSAVVIDEQ